MEKNITPPKGGSFRKGDRPSATFLSANPRYDQLMDITFGIVEMLKGERWIPAYDDDDFRVYFKWKLDKSSLYGLAILE